MAVKLLSPRGLVSVDWVADKKVRKGNILAVGDVVGFALADAAKGATVALCIEADLVEADKDAGPIGTGKAIVYNKGQMVVSQADARQLSKRTGLCGIAHDAAKAEDATVRMIWRNWMA